MKHSKNKLRFLWLFAYIGALSVVFVVIKSSPTHGVTTNEDYKEQVRSALAGINFAHNGNLAAITNTVQDLSLFMNYRAGVQISQTNKNLLASVEQNFSSNSKRVDASTLSGILTDIAREQIPQLSNAEIQNVTERFRGFNDPGLPPGFQQSRNFVTLRASGRGRMSITGFSNELTSLRNGGIDSKVAANMVYMAVSSEVDRKTKVLIEADPNFFGGTDSRMTPSQALFVAYAVITDDQMLYNQSNLLQRMQNIQSGIQQATGQGYPNPQGYNAYGDNGYIFSSPAQTVLTDSRVTRLLTLIQERGN